ncbi:dihydroxyacetone kinase family protein [Microbacterium protaetiae]|uniref:Dihydroxyacetone kinase family protein n=1 Tax=Microbacterium protaetiae TaxID=2509458 RepID=A0A4V0YDB4_9MICO|nr:dihydroxyacetone kinase family protein [Microbacterium protaetiae]QAY60121.1 dihydroxyacetone kinase family protein [Microbacterium protaetiae]
MSYVLNDAADFADESADGFVAAHRDLVRRVRGGVARAAATPAGQVAVVIGGGSGHYPAFAGLVGPGLAHAAAMGNVFASPSAQQVHAVAKAVATDAGVLLTYGNYAGDALNFDQAQEQLRAEGIHCETVRVTDDIFSAGSDEREKRRGIAGDLAVFRVAGWAAEQGRSLDDVAALAARANERTRSIGVAFSGCTLPGADAPLFTVPEGQMAVGMGIHGEPGIETVPLPKASELAAMLVERLLAERPDGAADRVAVIVNGLGSVKSEELFVLYGSIAAGLEAAGLVIVDPEVGEYATSFEMAGVSLTLLWLDVELEKAWRAPAYTPAYRKGVIEVAIADATSEDAPSDDETITAATTEEAAAAGRVAASALSAIHAAIDSDVDELGRLDAVAGDGDHGIGMQRGVRAADAAAAAAVRAGAGAGTVLTRAGDAWADKAGGTSGALWGRGLRAIGERLGNAAAPDPRAVAEAIAAARDAVQAFGKAKPGDKTLVDALVPFAQTLVERVDAGVDLVTAWKDAAAAATTAARATADLLPQMGRARPHSQKSLGTPDPGAVSLALAVTAVAAALAEHDALEEKEN